ncbi:hypothetical protein J4731_15330 [Providencia rettgeri]|nr:hypothetical protein [Providencia rettgeri]
MQRAYDKGDLSATEKLYQIYYPGQYCGNSDNVDMDKASQYLKEWIEKAISRKIPTNTIFIIQKVLPKRWEPSI